jgi:hypothetical protein
MTAMAWAVEQADAADEAADPRCWPGVRVHELDPEHVRSVLRRLAKVNPPVFGSEAHGFRLAPPLAEHIVAEFELAHRIRLPHEYRHFVTTLGDGGAGPYYGVLQLGYMDGLGRSRQPWAERDGFIGVLAQPFPLREAWNDLSSMPRPHMDVDDAAYDQELESFENAYWDPSRVNGAIPICHEGCGHRIWLVVSGDETGHLWYDGRASDAGLGPMVLKDGTRATFTKWYEQWLHDAAQQADAQPQPISAFGRVRRWLGGA